MFALLLTALALKAPPPPPRPIAILDVAASGVVEGVDRAEFKAVSDRVLAAFSGNVDLVVKDEARACADEDCAKAVADEFSGDVVWGTLSKNGKLFLLDLHLHEVAKGGSVMRARLEAPDFETLGKQIDDAAIRMVGGEPQVTLSPILVVGGVAGGLGVAAVVVGGAGVVWALTTEDKTADDLFVPSLITLGAGAVVAVVGISMVGAVADE